MRSLIAILLLAAAGIAPVAADFDEPPRTFFFMYVHHPEDDDAWVAAQVDPPHPFNEEGAAEGWPSYMEALGESVPDINYRAYDQAPLSHNWGWTQDQRITAEILNDYRPKLTAQLQSWQDLGINEFCRYVCAVKLALTPENRSGMYTLYDNWDEFREIMPLLGEKPAEEPWDWIQLRGGKKYLGSYWGVDAFGNQVYAGCVNDPAWRTYHRALAHYSAMEGYTGIFVDNPGNSCTCPDCQREWQRYLRERYAPEDLRAYFGVDDYAECELQGEKWAFDTRRFRAESVGAFLGAIKDGGEQARGEGSFFLCANGTWSVFKPADVGLGLVPWAKNGQDITFMEKRYHYVGNWQMPILPGVAWNSMDEQVTDHKMVHALDAVTWPGVRPDSISRPQHQQQYELAFCQALALDGVFIDGADINMMRRNPARERLFGWLRAHRDWTRTGESIAEVALFVQYDDLYLDYQQVADSVREFETARRALQSRGVLHDYVISANCTAERLARYDTIIVPSPRILTDEQAMLLRAYAEAGGTLIVTGPSGDMTGAGTLREAPLFGAEMAGEFTQSYFKPALSMMYGGKYKGPLHDVLAAEGDALELDRFGCINAPGVVISARRTADDEMLVNLINYNVDFTIEDDGKAYRIASEGEVHTQRDVEVICPVPEGLHAVSAEWLAPGDDSGQPLQVAAMDGGVRFTLPEVAMLSIVRLALADGAAEGPPMAEARAALTAGETGLPVYAMEDVPLAPVDGPVAQAPPSETPLVLRYSHHFGAIVEPGQTATVTAKVVPWLGEGKQALMWAAAPATGLLSDPVATGADGSHTSLTLTDPGMNAVGVDAGGECFTLEAEGAGLLIPAHNGQRLHFAGSTPPMYFHVPEGTESVPLRLQTRDKGCVCRVWDARGELVVDLQGETGALVYDPDLRMDTEPKLPGAIYMELDIPVVEGAEGIWRIEYTMAPERVWGIFGSDASLYFEDGFYGYLALRPEDLRAPVNGEG
jgi:hypothetical protein